MGKLQAQNIVIGFLAEYFRTDWKEIYEKNRLTYFRFKKF